MVAEPACINLEPRACRRKVLDHHPNHDVLNVSDAPSQEVQKGKRFIKPAQKTSTIYSDKIYDESGYHPFTLSLSLLFISSPTHPPSACVYTSPEPLLVEAPPVIHVDNPHGP